MPDLVFPYAAGGFGVHRPDLIAEVIGPNDAVINVRVRLDTGADFCAFPASYIPLFGLDAETLADGGDVYGIGEKPEPAKQGPVRVIIRVPWAPDTAYVEFPAQARFLESLDTLAIGLLGYQDFFERYKVVFDAPRRIFQIHLPDPD